MQTYQNGNSEMIHGLFGLPEWFFRFPIVIASSGKQELLNNLYIDIYIISSVMRAFWFVLIYDLLEDRRIDDVIIKIFFNSLLYKTNRFQVAVRLFTERPERRG